MTHIVVAGAGIGGLAAALALARTGAEVTVLERRPAPAEFGAWLQLSPNATRILRDLGALDILRPLGLEPQAVRIRRGRDAADLVRFPLGAHARERYGAPFLLVLRPDLQRVLAAQAGAAPRIALRFACEVQDVSIAPSGKVALQTSAGPIVADGFVEARGVGAAAARPSGRVAWRALVRADHVSADDLRPETNLWMGPRTHLVHYPLISGDRVNVVAVTHGHAQPVGQDDLWSRPAAPQALRQAFAGWHPSAMRLLDPEAEWRCWPLLEAAPLPHWSNGPLTRLGDAAHPMLPFLAQGASQAIEDSACLAACLEGESDIPAAFARYEARRIGRATRVQAASRRQSDIYHLARPAADARDLTLRLLGGARALARMDWLYAA